MVARGNLSPGGVKLQRYGDLPGDYRSKNESYDCYECIVLIDVCC